MKYALTVIVLILLWEFIPWLCDIPAFVLPRFSEAVAELVQNWPMVAINIAISGAAIVVSFAVSVCIAAVLALSVHCFPIARTGLEPLVLVSQLFPRVALAPMIMIWLGWGFGSKITIAVLIAFFPIYEGLRTGLLRANGNLLLQARLFGYSRAWRLFMLEVPLALPHFFVGLRTASLFAVVGVIVAEFLASGDGVGLRIVEDMARGNTASAFGYVLVVSVTGALFYATIALIEKLTLRRLHMHA